MTERMDVFSEIDLSYQTLYGACLSAVGWYDNVYRDESVGSNAPGYAASYHNNRYSSEVDRYINGPSGKILDAFIWTNLSMGNTPVNVKPGRHAMYCGEELLFPVHAVSYSQAPLDAVKAAISPGIETKELFLPIGQSSATAQVTDSAHFLANALSGMPRNLIAENANLVAESALAWSVGAEMTHMQRHEFTLRHADTLAQEKNVTNANGQRMVSGNGNVGGTDRGRLSFTYKTSFKKSNSGVLS